MIDRDLINKVKSLKEEKNAIILAHNYQIPEVQDIADFVGDSLDLAKRATKTDAKYIVFCGVNFMAESAKILNPNKIVLHPDLSSRCPMADMVNADDLRKFQDNNPDAATVAYVNTTAEIKALSDICCTSSNAVKVIKSLREKRIIFVPDRNLGLYVKRFVINKDILLWSGMCPTHHDMIKKEDVLKLKEMYPDAEILVHPECRPEVIDIADHVFSTNGMVKYVSKSTKDRFIIGTEEGLCYRLKKENPGKEFYPIKTAICPDMKKFTVEKIISSLESLEPVLELPEHIMRMARKPLIRMMEIGRGD